MITEQTETIYFSILALLGLGTGLGITFGLPSKQHILKNT